MSAVAALAAAAGQPVAAAAGDAAQGAEGPAIGWGTLALVNAVLAQGKGRGGFAWFLLSLLLGPVATLLLALLPALEDEDADAPGTQRTARLAVTDERPST